MSAVDPEKLTERSGIRARLVDLYCSSSSNPLLDDQATSGEAVDFAHHRGGIHVEGACEVGQRPSLVLVEEQLHEQTALCVAAEDRERLMMLHNTQYILRYTQDKAASRPTVVGVEPSSTSELRVVAVS